MKPGRPLSYTPPSVTEFDLSSFAAEVASKEEKLHRIYELSRKLQVALVRAKSSLTLEETDLSDVDELIAKLVPANASREPRDANLSYRLEEYVRVKAYSYFLETGTLIPRSQLPCATDEEYLAGACMGLLQDLSRYAMGRATVRDVNSVTVARNLVQEIQSEMLQFDFRNGPLRRKFDGNKYALKTLETLLYELSITGSDEEPEPKRLKEDLSMLIPKDELTDLRHRIEHRDELRETLIKKCRDGQKAAKQSIFALHRSDKTKAESLIEKCEKCIQTELLPIVNEEPPLRTGSFSNVLEEYAEAKLFHAWLFGKEGDGQQAVGDLLLPSDFVVDVGINAYLGGLCDLTGEVVRYAVQRGTARDTIGVKLALHSTSSVLQAIQTMERTPAPIGKKMEQLRRSVEKLERMLYEMSLSEATGRKVETTAENIPSENKDG